MAEQPGRAGTILAASLSHLWLVDIDAKVILADEKLPDGMVFAGFFGGRPGGESAVFPPHAMAWTVGGDPLIRWFRGTVAGAISSGDIRLPSSERLFSGGVQQSLLDDSLKRVTLVMSQDDSSTSPRRLWQFRLDDSLQLTRRNLGNGVDTLLLQNWVLIRHPVTLGKAERQKYGYAADSKFLKGYNLRVLQSSL
jgi:hypothetical protein